jgi:hypothetical protein
MATPKSGRQGGVAGKVVPDVSSQSPLFHCRSFRLPLSRTNWAAALMPDAPGGPFQAPGQKSWLTRPQDPYTPALVAHTQGGITLGLEGCRFLLTWRNNRDVICDYLYCFSFLRSLLPYTR